MAMVPSDTLPAAQAGETFDAVLRIIAQTRLDSTLGGPAWSDRGAAMRAATVNSRSMQELRGVLRDLLSPLGGSHLRILPKDRVDAGAPARPPIDDPSSSAPAAIDSDIGADLRVLNGLLLVWRVRADGPAARSGIRPGWIVRAIDGCFVGVAPGSAGVQPDPTRLERAQVSERTKRLLRGTIGSWTDVELRDGEDRPRLVTLTRVATPGRVAELSNLLPARVSVVWTRQRTSSGSVVGVLLFDA